MRGRVFLTAEYHRDTGAISWEEAVEHAQHWTYRGAIWYSANWPVCQVTEAVISSELKEHQRAWLKERGMDSKWCEEPCGDVVIPWHSVRLIEVDDA